MSSCRALFVGVCALVVALMLAMAGSAKVFPQHPIHAEMVERFVDFHRVWNELAGAAGVRMPFDRAQFQVVVGSVELMTSLLYLASFGGAATRKLAAIIGFFVMLAALYTESMLGNSTNQLVTVVLATLNFVVLNGAEPPAAKAKNA
eukprot:TRINITY_DN67015_c13_g1_i1.p2 TRINITY_DN67015_c13_g1~~TRINITY_DN67015_c13_g1_i1.p2  ORF type:complete len:147 (+),score=63.76 TRINITY_DN67015_c13_g1_i1:157-597(+)